MTGAFIFTFMTYKDVFQLAESKGYNGFIKLTYTKGSNDIYVEMCLIQKWLWEEHWLWIWVTMDCTTNEILGFDYHIHRAITFPVLRINGEPELSAEQALLKAIHHALTLI